MTVLITFTTIGADAGPFNLYSDANAYCCAFEVGITSAQLLAGFPSNNVPEGTTNIRAYSTSLCTNYVDLPVSSNTCFNFLPIDETYLLSTVRNTNNTYVYGAFEGYQEAGVATSSNHLIKLNLDKSIEVGFNIGTGFNEILYSGSYIIQQSDGKIIVTGTFTTYQGVGANRIIRLNTDGSRDSSFVIGTGFDGFTQIPAIDNAGRIIVTGIFNTYNGVNAPRIARLFTSYKGIPEPHIIKIDSVGNKDVSFNAGTGFDDVVYDVIVIWGNKLFVSGYFTSYDGVTAIDFILLNADGSILYAPDVTYGTPFILGDNLVAQIETGCLETIFTKPI
jgi:hypothetical protein